MHTGRPTQAAIFIDWLLTSQQMSPPLLIPYRQPNETILHTVRVKGVCVCVCVRARTGTTALIAYVTMSECPCMFEVLCVCVTPDLVFANVFFHLIKYVYLNTQASHSLTTAFCVFHTLSATCTLTPNCMQYISTDIEIWLATGSGGQLWKLEMVTNSGSDILTRLYSVCLELSLSMSLSTESWWNVG